MKLENSIGWCDDTTNAVTGCDKVSPGCKNCYAQVGTRARVLRARGTETWGPHGTRHPVAECATKMRRLNQRCICDHCHKTYPVDTLENGVRPTQIDHDCELRRIRLFADSNSDWLDKWPVEILAAFLNEIRLAPNIDVLLLTKRIGKFESRILQVVEGLSLQNPGDGPYPEDALNLEQWLLSWFNNRSPQNIWLGVSVEDQKRADERIPQLLSTPSATRFLSVEPLLEPVDLDLAERNHKRGETIDWVIVGGESGDGRRDCGVDAIVAVAEQCQSAAVPIYVKQDCAFKSGQPGRIPERIWNLKQFPRLHPSVNAMAPP